MKRYEYKSHAVVRRVWVPPHEKQSPLKSKIMPGMREPSIDDDPRKCFRDYDLRACT